MSIRTKLQGKTTIHEYDHEFTNTGASIRLFVKIRGWHGGFDTPFANPAQDYSTTDVNMNLSSFLLSLFFLRDLRVLCGEK
ncbi:MAG: hypothetical protein CNIPEHKO_00931 [Anaerolineales bacterium]|nr:hypothetical protein [Anaerolineales bacterium]